MTNKQKMSPFDKIKIHPLRNFWLAALLVTSLWLLGVPQHSYYYIKCGGEMPVRITRSMWDGFAASSGPGYMIPTDEHYYAPPYLLSTTFFCTEQEAIDKGLSPDFWSDYIQNSPSPSTYKDSK